VLCHHAQVLSLAFHKGNDAQPKGYIAEKGTEKRPFENIEVPAPGALGLAAPFTCHKRGGKKNRTALLGEGEKEVQ